MNATKLIKRIAGVALVLTLLRIQSSLFASLIVSSTVTPTLGGQFNYEISIVNEITENVSIVSLTDAPPGDPAIVASLRGPDEFFVSYDPGLGIVDLIEGIGVFTTNTTQSGFSFTSNFGPTNNFMAFEALTVNGNLIRGNILKTINPNAAVPEPETAILFAAGLGILAWKSKRKGLKN